MKLSGVMIGTEDSKPLGEFYTKVFGEPGWNQDNWYGYDIDGGNLMIGPHSEVKGKNGEPARIITTYATDDVQGEFDRIKSAGATVVAEPYQPDAENYPKMWLATLADPEGNYLQLSTPWQE